MSWPTWPGGAVPQPGVVPAPLINSAPNVNPVTPIMPNSQYTPEQWAQMQQQNWQQWAQWQQQFQQWQQQYGAEYQKSISALAQNRPAPVQPAAPPMFTNAPPPLPTEVKPPLPPDEPQGGPPMSQSFNAPPPPVPHSNAQPNQPSPRDSYLNPLNVNLNKPPPSHRQSEPFKNDNQSPKNDHSPFKNENQQQFNRNFPNTRGPPPRNQNWQNQQGFGNNNRFNQQNQPANENFAIKRPYNQSVEPNMDFKRNKLDYGDDSNKWQSNVLPLKSNEGQSKPLDAQTWNIKPVETVIKTNPEELSEAEKKFDKQFAEWESQFQKWKEQNANHPDKEQYKEYEKKWETWRAQLLDRREQMKRKRLGLTGESPQPGSDKVTHDTPEIVPVVSEVAAVKSVPIPLMQNILPKPGLLGVAPGLGKPVLLGSEPVPSSVSAPDTSHQRSDDEGSFFKSFSSGGIPGLDLVKHGKDENLAEEEIKEEPDSSKKPDLEAISRGINNILGDQKLLNMLSMVSQNRTNISNSSSTVPSKTGLEESNPEGSISYDGFSNQGNADYVENKGPNEVVSNIVDEQTRSSFNFPSEVENVEASNSKNNNFGGKGDSFNRDFHNWNQNEDNVGSNFNRFNKHGFNKGSDTFKKGPDTFNKGPDTFNRGPNTLNRGLDMFNKGPDSFNRDPDPFNRDPDLFNRDPDSFNKGSDTSNRGSDTSNRGLDSFNRGLDTLNKGPDTFNRGSDSFNRGPDSFNRGPDSFNRDPDSFNRNLDTFKKGPDSFNRDLDTFKNDPDTFNRGSDTFNIGPDTFNKGPDTFNKGPDTFKRGSDSFNKGPNSFNRGPDSFNRGPDSFNRGSDSYNRGSDSFNRGPDTFNRGPDTFNKGLDTFNKGPDTFNKGPDAFNRGPDTFNRGPDNLNTRFDKGNKDFSGNRNFNENINQEQSNNFARGNSFGGNRDNYERYHDNFKGNHDDFEGNYDNFESNADNFNNPENNFNRGFRNNNKQSNFNQNFENVDPNFKSFNRDFKPNNRGQGGFPQQQRFNDIPPRFNEKSDGGSRFEGGSRSSRDSLFVNRDSQELGSEDHFNRGNEPNISQPVLPNDSKRKEPEENLSWTPEQVIDYEHKTLKPVEPEICVELIYTFDYRHKPLNRIPFPQRPRWLANIVKNYPQFDMPYNLRQTQLWHSNNERYGNRNDSYDKYDRSRSFDYEEPERNFFDREPKESPDYYGRRPYNIDNRDSGYSPKFEAKPKERNLEIKKENEDKVFKFSPPDPYQNNEPLFKKDVKEEKQMSKTQEVNLSEPVRETKSSISSIEDILNPPGRFNRPPRLVIILRGPSGSGKSFLAKLIKDKEVENGGSAPRILCLDDYFMVEQEKEVEQDGRREKVKEMVYEFEAGMEVSYRQSLMKSFKKTITDGYFNFIIVDNVNDKVKYFAEMWSFAKQNGFQVYISELEIDIQLCAKRNTHGRTEVEIKRCVLGWEKTPSHHPIIDCTSLIQSGSIPEVDMEEINSPPSDDVMSEEREFLQEHLSSSKWDNFDYSIDKLAKLDGISKPLRHSRTMEDYLQLDDDWVQPLSTKPGQKRVRWADLEERKEQEKMRAIGFVVGQTNWDRMMDPTMGSSALTQTKYIDRYN